MVHAAHYSSEIDPRRAHRVIAGLVLAFLDLHLKGRPVSLAEAATRWPEATAVRVIE